MQYVKLGRTGCEVSRLCLGTMNFGPRTSEPDSFRIMDRALELGYNFFDTANAYGRAVRVGYTEEIIGRWLAQGGGRREGIVLATKVYAPLGSEPNRGHGLSGYKIKREVEESLRRLQTDHIDLYQMHHIDRSVGWDEVWGAFEDLIAQGKVIYAGSSNFAAWDIATAQGFARQRHFLGIVSEQHRYSLLFRQPELEVLPCCLNYGIAVIPYGPMGGGFFSGHARKPPEEKSRAASGEMTKLIQKWGDRLDPYEALCKKLGHAPADLALAFVLHHPAITSPIIGPRTLEQLEGSTKALDICLDDETLARLEELFPGPGGSAPEAYAW